jgi:hypothetical protein
MKIMQNGRKQENPRWASAADLGNNDVTDSSKKPILQILKIYKNKIRKRCRCKEKEDTIAE